MNIFASFFKLRKRLSIARWFNFNSVLLFVVSWNKTILFNCKIKWCLNYLLLLSSRRIIAVSEIRVAWTYVNAIFNVSCNINHCGDTSISHISFSWLCQSQQIQNYSPIARKNWLIVNIRLLEKFIF